MAGEINFKNGFSIDCHLVQKRELDENGNEKNKGYIVNRVNRYFVNDIPIETEEGRKILAHELTHIHQQKKDILKGETTKESLEKEAENTEKLFEHQTENIKTVKIGNNVYKLNEHEYKKFMQDTKNIIEEELEAKLRRLNEEESLKLLYTYKEMLENREFIWQQ